MKIIYNAILERLKSNVPELKWIDLDEGQLNNYHERPPVAFPCALVDIELNDCNTLYGRVQLCQANVAIRVAQKPPTSHTNSVANAADRATALERYDLVDNVYAALQDFDGGGLFNGLSRASQAAENRNDGLFVCRINFRTEFKDDPDQP